MSLGFVKTFDERKILSVQEMSSLLIEFSREKENIFTRVVGQRLVIESLLLRVGKLEDSTKGSVNGEEISFMKVSMIVDEISSIRVGKIIGKNPSKRNIREKTGMERAKIGYQDNVCYHCHKRCHIQYTYNKLKRDLQNLKLLKDMKKPITEVSDGEKLKGKKRLISFETNEGNVGRRGCKE